MIDKKINTLLTVCETGNYTKAAQILDLTQPAVSQQIKQLENELHVRLFNRSEGELKLTRDGEVVLKYARRIQMLYGNLRQALKDQKNKLDRLSIGITHTVESSPITEALASFSTQKDDLRITLITDTFDNLYNKLKTYEIDLAIVEGRIGNPDYRNDLLDTDSLVLAVSNQNPLSNKDHITLNELAKQKLILRLPSSGTRNLFTSYLETQNLSLDNFNVILEVDSIATIKDLVERDFGVTVISKSVLSEELRKNKIQAIPIENLSILRETNVVYHQDFEHQEIIQEFIRLYRNSKHPQ